MVEFALILPVLLLVIIGIMEFGRLLFFYSSITSASREGARYGSAVGEVADGYRYLDCDGIRSAALRAGSFAGLQEENITIQYDNGLAVLDTTCPPTSNIRLTDRVVVTAAGSFQPVVPLLGVFFPEDGLDITSTTARTIIKQVGIYGTPAPHEVGACPTSGSITSGSSSLIFSITNINSELNYRLKSIVITWPDDAPGMDSISFATYNQNFSPPKAPPLYSYKDDLIWEGSLTDPEIFTTTFNDVLSSGEYKVKVRFFACPEITGKITIPDL